MEETSMRQRQNKKHLQKMLGKKWPEGMKQSQESMISQRLCKEHMWPAAVKAAGGTGRMRSEECPGDPARRRSMGTPG